MKTITFILLSFIRFYRFAISPLLGPHCRFYPTCSAYAIEAINVHGPLKGTFLSIKRLSCCHPLHSGGVDLVPPNNKAMAQE